MVDRWEHRVVVGVDHDTSEVALAVAAAEADRRELPLLLLAAHPEQDGPDTLLAVLRHRVQRLRPGIETTGLNVTGDLADALIEASRQAALVVVDGHHDRRRPDGAAAAHLANRVAANSQCPTLVVPPETEAGEEGPVLLAVGLTAEDEPTISYAFEAAGLRQVPLVATHVWSGVPGNALGAVGPFTYDLREAQAAADRMLADALADWNDKHPEVRVQRMALYDTDVAQTVTDAADRASLVVVGACGSTARSSHRLGPVPRTLIRRAHRPVAVIR